MASAPNTADHNARRPTSAAPPRARLAPEIKRLLRGIRWRLRGYVLVEGLAIVAAFLGLAFWLSLGFDWWQEPFRIVRVGVVGLAVIGFCGLMIWYLVRRLAVSLDDRRLAVLVERRYPQFHDSLVTAVELADRSPSDHGFSVPMFERAARGAAAETAAASAGGIFDAGPLWRAVAVAAGLAVSIAVLALVSPRTIAIWGRRTFALSNEIWPRRTDLLIEGFDRGVVKIARGADLKVVVKANAKKRVPEVVRIDYEFDEGNGDLRTMTREGAVDPRRPFQAFTHVFPAVPSALAFDVFGGDDAIRGLRVEVVESPALENLVLHCEYPAYTGKTPGDVRAGAAVDLPQGTQVSFSARSTKPLVRVAIDRKPAESDPATLTIEAVGGVYDRAFRVNLGALSENEVLSFTLYDRDGITNRDPVKLTLIATPDRPPVATARLHGIGAAITPQARVPLEGKLADDYGLAESWFEYSIDDGEPARRPLQASGTEGVEVELDESFEVGDLDLKPSQKLLLGVKVLDNCGLDTGPQEGVGERFLLNVVSPEDLLMLLLARELNLRQRFEATREEVETTRDLLVGLDFAALQGEAAEQTLASRRLAAERAAQNGRKNSQETEGVARAFEQIREELINNRIENDELRSRLQERIVLPLLAIVETGFPELDRRLEELKEGLADPAAGPPARDSAVAQLNEIVTQMNLILDAMEKLENFSELVARMRRIVELQAEIQAATRERGRAGLEE